MTNLVIFILPFLVIGLANHRGYRCAYAHAPPTTSTSSPTGSLEDPSNSATTGETGPTVDEEAVCLRCYEHVRLAQKSIAGYDKLVKKQKELINQKQQQISAHGPPAQRKAKSRLNPPQVNKTQIVGRNRTLADLLEREPIVVSRLRVARSSNDAHYSDRMPQNDLAQTRFQSNQVPALDSGHTDSVTNIDTQAKQKKELELLKQLKHKQDQQINQTCRSLYEVQKCLNEISRECLGNLQFHSHEVFFRQWVNKLNCPPAHNPSFKPFAALTRSIPKAEEPERLPVPRPITSQEETRKRLEAIFSSGFMNPLGVMLKPTLTRSASQKFNSINQDEGRHLLSTSSIIDYEPKQPTDNQIGFGQIMLIPCFFVLLVAFVTLTSRLLKQLNKP